MVRTDWTLMRHIARPAVTASLLLGLAGGLASPALAQDGGPQLPPPPAGCTEVATGLLSPRHIVVGDDGTLYISETGTGGDMPVLQPEAGAAEVGTPEGEPAEVSTDEEATAVAEGEDPEGEPAEGEEGAMPPSTRGYTGQVTMVAPDGTQSVLADGFASYSDGVGPGGLTLLDGALYLVVGGAAASMGAEQIDGENSVFRIDPATGETELVAELGTYEIENNPDGQDVNPNLYGIAAGPDGLLYVADAGGNTVYAVDPATGDFELVLVLPTLDGLLGGEETGTPTVDAAQPPRQAVPTDLAFNADGQLVISLLSEGWPADAPSILALEDDGTLTPVADGLSGIVSIVYGPDGALYATQISSDFETFAPGTLLRITDEGTAEPAVEGLFAAHGVAFDADGNALAGIVALALGPGVTGSVLSCEGVAAGA